MSSLQGLWPSRFTRGKSSGDRLPSALWHPAALCRLRQRATSNLLFPQSVEYLPRQQIIPELAVKRLKIPVSLGAAQLDVERSHSHLAQPLLHCLGHRLWSTVEAGIGGWPSLQEQMSQSAEVMTEAVSNLTRPNPDCSHQALNSNYRTVLLHGDSGIMR